MDKVKRTKTNTNPLLKHSKWALKELESWIHDRLDGTGMLEVELSELEPLRKAIAREEKKCQKNRVKPKGR